MGNPFEEIASQLSRLESTIQQLLKLGAGQPAPVGVELPISIERAAELLDLSHSRIYQNPDIPKHKRNGKLYFFETELIYYIRHGKKMPPVEPGKPYKKKRRSPKVEKLAA